MRARASKAVVFAVLLARLGSVSAARAQLAEEGPTPLSFGRVPIDQPLEQTIAFENPLDRELRIASIRLTPPLVATDWTKAIAPRARGSFTFRLGEPRRPGLYEGAIIVDFVDGAIAPLRFEVSGTLVPPVEVQPFSAIFVATQRGEAKEASVEIVNHRPEPLRLGAPPPATERYTARIETVEPGKRYRLTVRMSGQGRAGRVTESLSIPTGEAELGALKVQLNTLLNERVYTFPDEIYFGALPVAQVRDPAIAPQLAQTLMLFRKGQPGFEAQFASSLDCVRVRAERGPDGDRWQITLELDPAKTPVGALDGRLVVTTNDPEFGRLEVPIRGAVLAGAATSPP